MVIRESPRTRVSHMYVLICPCLRSVRCASTLRGQLIECVTESATEAGLSSGMNIRVVIHHFEMINFDLIFKNQKGGSHYGSKRFAQCKLRVSSRGGKMQVVQSPRSSAQHQSINRMQFRERLKIYFAHSVRLYAEGRKIL
jgi:hypothetical protein